MKGAETEERTDISIHALCEEGDQPGQSAALVLSDFYPRPLRGGRLVSSVGRRRHENFYPRPLRGGRPPQSAYTHHRQQFLSTPSARRATPGR